MHKPFFIDKNVITYNQLISEINGIATINNPSEIEILAVGNPIVLPSFFPSATFPEIKKTDSSRTKIILASVFLINFIN